MPKPKLDMPSRPPHQIIADLVAEIAIGLESAKGSQARHLWLRVGALVGELSEVVKEEK